MARRWSSVMASMAVRMTRERARRVAWASGAASGPGGGLAVAHHAHDEAEQEVLVVPHEVVERLEIAGQRPLDQALVACVHGLEVDGHGRGDPPGGWRRRDGGRSLAPDRPYNPPAGRSGGTGRREGPKNPLGAT